MHVSEEVGRQSGADITPACRCGCGRPGRTKKGYFEKGCSLRAIPRAVRSARSRLTAKRPEMQALWKKNGSKGGKKHAQVQWQDMLDRWAELARRYGPSHALKVVYWRGYTSGYQACRKGQASKAPLAEPIVLPEHA